MTAIRVIRVFLWVLFAGSIVFGIVMLDAVAIWGPILFLSILGLIITAVVGKGMKAFGRKEAASGSFPAGWYPDPTPGSTRMRFWDGIQWTEHYSLTPPSAVAGSTYPQTQAVQPAMQQQYAPVPQPGAAPNYYYAQAMAMQPMAQMSKKSTQGLAIWSLVCGILSIVISLIGWLFSIVGVSSAVVGIILGVLALKKQKGALSIIGIVLSSLGVVLSILMTLYVCFVLLSTQGIY